MYHYWLVLPGSAAHPDDGRGGSALDPVPLSPNGTARERLSSEIIPAPASIHDNKAPFRRPIGNAPASCEITEGGGFTNFIVIRHPTLTKTHNLFYNSTTFLLNQK
jgi:hypothetical protein